MNNYGKLLHEADSKGIFIDEDFPLSEHLSGLYIDGNIALSNKLKTTAVKACVLAEELGHHETTVGNIIDMSVSWNRKQERQARLNGYQRTIGLMGIVKAYEAGCQNQYEISEFLNVTEEYLLECIECYRDKYGIMTNIDNYTIYFIPNLAVLKMV